MIPIRCNILHNINNRELYLEIITVTFCHYNHLPHHHPTHTSIVDNIIDLFRHCDRQTNTCNEMRMHEMHIMIELSTDERLHCNAVTTYI